MKHAWAAFLLAAVLQTEEPLKPGLLGEYFSIGQEIQDFPTIAVERKPGLRRIDKEINFEVTAGKFAGTEFEDQFYVRWTGVIRIAKDAKYTFFLESDDGSRLFIGGKPIVDNGGVHPMEEKSGDVELKAGDHEFKLELFENGGEAGCKLSWETAGQEKKIVPAAVFLHKKDKDLDKD